MNKQEILNGIVFNVAKLSYSEHNDKDVANMLNEIAFAASEIIIRDISLELNKLNPQLSDLVSSCNGTPKELVKIDMLKQKIRGLYVYRNSYQSDQLFIFNNLYTHKLHYELYDITKLAYDVLRHPNISKDIYDEISKVQVIITALMTEENANHLNEITERYNALYEKINTCIDQCTANMKRINELIEGIKCINELIEGIKY